MSINTDLSIGICNITRMARNNINQAYNNTKSTYYPNIFKMSSNIKYNINSLIV